MDLYEEVARLNPGDRIVYYVGQTPKKAPAIFADARRLHELGTVNLFTKLLCRTEAGLGTFEYIAERRRAPTHR